MVVERRHGEGRRLVPADLQEGAAGPGDRAREPAADRLPGRLGRRLPAAPGRDLPRPGALRPRLLQQRPPLRRGDLPDGRHHGLLRGRRRLPADHERRVAHRGGDRLDLPRRLPPGAGGDRREDRQRGAGRRARPVRHLGRGGPPPSGRRLLPGEDPQPVRPARRAAAGAVRPPRAGRAALSGRGPLRPHADRPLPPLRHPRDAGPAARRQRARRVQGHLRPDAGLRHRLDRGAGGGDRGQPALGGAEADGHRRRRTASCRSAASSTRTRRTRRRASSSCATRRRSRSCSSRTSPASWSAAAPSAAASSRTAPRW